MAHIISKSILALALAGFLIPATAEYSDAGQRYQYTKKFGSYRHRSPKYRNNGFVLHIPDEYLYDPFYAPTDFTNRTYIGGPQIIDVQKVLRERKRRKQSN